ncbi:DUF2244 domain-containing protein [Sneathiella sp.]|uniref:DUF2244 domain-containing protein n=1 Tax=Sneathiella sp. TaxID=1964365 RepID=UPI00262B6F41|nr:DUF2244 domain-containing protein [Sneathiella sp.]MDF2367692.1 DUF2244 domain-containing protein [Sneathiella sp.]
MHGECELEGEDSSPRHAAGEFFLSLHPNRSLSQSGFVILMVGVALVSFISGMVFLSMGAWPVLGFFGLDALLIYLAFRLNFRAARRYETVQIHNDLFTITRTAPDGAEKMEAFDAYWARSMVERGQLCVTNRGKSYEIGNFLGEDEKIEVQELIAKALDTYRKGGILQSPSPSTSIIS